MDNVAKDHLVMIVGESATGKSASLKNLPNHERVLYLNCESGKKLPFRNKFKSVTITDPYDVPDFFDEIRDNPGHFDYIVIDTLTLLMEMYESIYVLGSSNTMKAWSDYAQYFKNLMQDKVAKCEIPVIFLAHTRSELNETTMEYDTRVPVKGSLKNIGIEAYFSTVVAVKKVSLKELSNYSNDMLNITEEDEMLGYKHVFQTRPTKATKNERMRGPMDMFSVQETYIDSDANVLMNHLFEYYS